MKRAGDRSGGERKNIDCDAKPHEPLLVFHAKSLLFINDDQAQVLEVDVVADDAVGADDDIDRTRSPLEGLMISLGVLKRLRLPMATG